jgi:formate C-acetyltransferase
MFNTPKGKASFIALAKAFFAGGGQQYTVTVISPDELIDAKLNPENHKNLIVRVGGYSDYFTSLTPELQDNVIERTLNDI